MPAFVDENRVIHGLLYWTGGVMLACTYEVIGWDEAKRVEYITCITCLGARRAHDFVMTWTSVG